MVRSGNPDGARDQRSLGDLVALALKDISQLIHHEIALAKSELRVDMRRIRVAAVLIGGGVIIVFPGVILLCFAYAYFLHWAGAWGGLAGAFGFAGLTFFVLAGIACFAAFLGMRKFTGMRLTRKTVVDDIGMLRRAAGGDGVSAADGASPVGGRAAAEAVGGEAQPGITEGSPGRAGIPARS